MGLYTIILSSMGYKWSYGTIYDYMGYIGYCVVFYYIWMILYDYIGCK